MKQIQQRSVAEHICCSSKVPGEGGGTELRHFKQGYKTAHFLFFFLLCLLPFFSLYFLISRTNV